MKIELDISKKDDFYFIIFPAVLYTSDFNERGFMIGWLWFCVTFSFNKRLKDSSK
ncbi:unnamed protein product [marine sediment metagenome]|uniref:Uncharacterized protein n=1 Tax=marine sediment metagenome TaxID=412755 RepID=X1CYT7_9ZZZZ